jgi:ABC-type bacteriocin/lantibiotic exporter with double-glycine peptidase domain
MSRDRLRALWSFYSGSRHLMVMASLLSVLEVATLLPIGVLVHDIFQHQINDHDGAGILSNGLVIGLLYLTSVGLLLAAQRLSLIAASRSAMSLRAAALAAVYAAPVFWHDQRQASRLHNDIVIETERTERIAEPVVALARAAVVGLPLFAAAVYVSPVLSTVMLVVLPLLLVLGAARRQPIQQRIAQWQRSSREFSVHVHESLRSIRLVRMRSAERAELSASNRLASDVARDQVRKAWAQQLAAALQGAIAVVAGTFVLVLGGILVARDSLSLGELLAFYAITALLLRTAAGTSGQASALITALTSLQRVGELLDEIPSDGLARGTASPSDGSLELRGVTFKRDGRAILQDASLLVQRGSSIAVMGLNGAGKTTLVELVLGFQAPDCGEIRIGGVSLEALDMVAARQTIGYVPQEPMLRPTTLAANILYGREHHGASELQRVAAISAVDELAGAMRDGLQTWIGDDGIRLSGGQRQRVAIARALVGRPSIVILDEPTNHLDEGVIADLVDHLATSDPPVTVLLITHDRGLADRCDRVVTLASGVLVEGGLKTRHDVVA